MAWKLSARVSVYERDTGNRITCDLHVLLDAINYIRKQKSIVNEHN